MNNPPFLLENKLSWKTKYEQIKKEYLALQQKQVENKKMQLSLDDIRLAYNKAANLAGKPKLRISRNTTKAEFLTYLSNELYQFMATHDQEIT